MASKRLKIQVNLQFILITRLIYSYKRVSSLRMLQAMMIKLINSYLAFSFFLFYMTTLLQLGVHSKSIVKNEDSVLRATAAHCQSLSWFPENSMHTSLKKLADGKGLAGAGRLTLARVDTMQNFYGRALRDNKNNVKGMAKATSAILKNYSSTVENPQHQDCPEGASSWCSYQRDVANGTDLHKPVKNLFPDAVVEVIQPLFDRLGDEPFLAGCENCYIQNRNESLHHVIWGMVSKEVYSSPQEISMAISLGVLQFNQGISSTYSELLPLLGIEAQQEMGEACQWIDEERVYQAEYRNTPEIKLRRKKKRKDKLKKQDAFVHQEGAMYKSQAFHGGNQQKTKPWLKGKRKTHYVEKNKSQEKHNNIYYVVP